ncbi:Uma2 family endonuclease [Desulfococcaceae bacterium HSG8]|nr:Uma2 family endonuclease [Desulfococcaceae bacterium HSG8]
MEALQRTPRMHHEEYEEIPFSEDGTSKEGLAVSEEEYWEKYYENASEFIYEWNRGYLEVKPMGDMKAGRIYRWFNLILECYLAANPVGTIVPYDIGFRLALPTGVIVRIPDISLILNKNTDKIGDDDCTYNGIFDLCIESLSYSSLKYIVRDTVEKKREYQGIGVKEYYILDARKKETAFYRLNKSGRYGKIRPVKGDIIRSQELPGFQFRISDLYRQPLLGEMTDDGVYCGYVLPSYQEVKQRADQAQEQLISERQKTEQKTIETVRSMLSDNMLPDLIIKYTGLSADEITAIRQTMDRK